MDRIMFKKAAAAAKSRRRQRRRRSTFTALAAVVVFVTVYLLILPAITMEREQTCPLEEHLHTEACYAEVLTCELPTEPQEALTCGQEEAEGHAHDPTCLPIDAEAYGEPVCGLAEDENHVHTLLCYAYLTLAPDAEPQPIEQCWTCGLEPSEGHVHTPECYEMSEPHVHGPECYAMEPACGLEEHAHSDECFAPLTEVFCGKDEHIHSGECFDEDGHLTCEVEEHAHTGECLVEPEEEAEPPVTYCGFEAHTHGETCFDPDGALICGLEEHEHTLECQVEPETYCGFEAHAHGETCLDEAGELACGLEEHQHTEECFTAPEYFCGREAHTHEEACYDADQNLICRQEEHQHTEECTVPPTWYCGMDEHVHHEECFDADGNLICGAEEHTHSEACLVEPTWYCGKEAHVHSEACFDENGELACGLEEHEHTEDCKTLEGVSLKRVDDPSQLDPNTAYAIVMEEDGKFYLVRSSEGYPDLQPIRLQETVDENGEAFATFEITRELEAEKEAEAEAKALEEARRLETEARTFHSLERDEEYAAFGITPTALSRGEVLPDEPQEEPAEPLPLPDACLWTPEQPEAPQAPVLLDNLAAETQMEAVAQEGQWNVANPGMAMYTDPQPEGPKFMLFEAGETNQTPDSLWKQCNVSTCTLPWNEWTPPTGANPFGGAQGFNIFILGDLENWGATHGNAAIMGNINGTNNDITYDLDSNFNYAGEITPKFKVGLVLGGVYNAKTTASGTESITVANGSVVLRQEAFDKNNLQIRGDDHFHIYPTDSTVIKDYFETARSQLHQRNQETFDYATGDAIKTTTRLGTVQYVEEKDVSYVAGTPDNQKPPLADTGASPDKDLYLIGLDPLVNVFNLTADQVSRVMDTKQARQLFLDIPYGSYVIFNIIGEVKEGLNKTDYLSDYTYEGSSDTWQVDEPVSINDFAILLWLRDSNRKWHQEHNRTNNNNYMQTRYIMWNFDPKIEEANIRKEGYVYGSMLAPNLDWVGHGVSMNNEGTIVLEDVRGVDASGGSDVENNNSNFIYSPFIAGAEATVEKKAHCVVHNSYHDAANQPEDENCKFWSGSGVDWSQYYAKIEMECLDDVGSSVKTFFIDRIPLTGENVTPVRVDGIAPGNYRKVSETFYTIGQDGKPVPVTNPFLDHYFSHVTFDVEITVDNEEVPETRSDILVIPEGGVVLKITLTNHYTQSEPFELSVEKIWKDSAGNIITSEDEIPAGTVLQVQLYQTKSTSKHDGKPYGSPIMLRKGNWSHTWSGLPKKDETDDLDWYYYVVETLPQAGYEPSYEPSGKNVSAAEVAAGGAEFCLKVINTSKGFEPTEITVEKTWERPDGTPLDPVPENYSATVQLYQEIATIDESKMHKVTINLGSETEPLVQAVANGSSAVFNISFWSDANLQGAIKPSDFFTYDGTAIRDCRLSYVGTPQHIGHGIIIYWKYLLTIELANIQADTNLNFEPIKNPSGQTEATYDICGDAGTEHDNFHPVLTFVETVNINMGVAWSGQLKPYDPGDVVDAGKEILNANNDWHKSWKVPLNNAEEMPDKKATQFYRYYVLETAMSPNGCEVFYRVNNSKPYTDVIMPDGTSDILFKDVNGMPGITEGIITVTNQEKPGYALPETGGVGTEGFTALGAALLGGGLAGASVTYRKRRKGDRQNRSTH